MANVMRIDIIDNLEAFARLKPDWEAVYQADPEAQFFLSWTWMSKWLPMLEGPWFILAVTPTTNASDYVGFFPLRLRLKERKAGGFYNEINMAGNFSADYTGFICTPEFQNRVIPALAACLKRLNWTRLNLENIQMSDERRRLFLSHFSKKEFDTKEHERVNKRDNINNRICPYAALPNDWDSYLAGLSANTRQKIRRFLRQIEGSDEFRITHADADSVERDLKVLLRFWGAKWGPRKGNRLNTILTSNFKMLKSCSESGALFLPVLWRGETPLGALASLIDPYKKSFLFYVGGRDETFNNPPPGLLLHAHSIRYAIAGGFKIYDFLRGNEPYKYSLATVERRISCITVSTRHGGNLHDKLDPRSLHEVLERTTELHQTGHFRAAELGYRQILATDPQSEKGLYCLGQLMATKGRHGAAARLFETLVSIKPASEKAWLRLGQSLEAKRRFFDAADAYRQVIALRPELAVAHNNLGGAFFKLGRFDEAISAFDKAIKLQPGYIEAEVSRANTLHMLGTLPAEKRSHYAELNVRLGDKFRKNGAVSFAIHCYRQAIAMQGDLVQAHYSLARALQSQNDVDGALLSYRKVVEIDPSYSDAPKLVSALSPESKRALSPARTPESVPASV
jgi:tetratricopeptide (TPR) repeat protein